MGVKYDDEGMQKRLISIGQVFIMGRSPENTQLLRNMQQQIKSSLSLSLSFSTFSTNRQIDDPAIQGAETEGSLWTTHNPGK